jgi:hypothetical protein
MPRADAIPKLSTHISDASSKRADSARMPGEGSEPELDFVNRDRVLALTDFRVSRPAHFRGISKPRTWHRPFAEAVLTGDSIRVHEAIVHAQRAILNRYLELASGWEAQPEEAADLANAVDILQALKRTTDLTPIY